MAYYYAARSVPRPAQTAPPGGPQLPSGSAWGHTSHIGSCQLFSLSACPLSPCWPQGPAPPSQKGAPSIFGEQMQGCEGETSAFTFHLVVSRPPSSVRCVPGPSSRCSTLCFSWSGGGGGLVVWARLCSPLLLGEPLPSTHTCVRTCTCTPSPLKHSTGWSWKSLGYNVQGQPREGLGDRASQKRKEGRQ